MIASERLHSFFNRFISSFDKTVLLVHVFSIMLSSNHTILVTMHFTLHAVVFSLSYWSNVFFLLLQLHHLILLMLISLVFLLSPAFISFLWIVLFFVTSSASDIIDYIRVKEKQCYKVWKTSRADASLFCGLSTYNSDSSYAIENVINSRD